MKTLIATFSLALAGLCAAPAMAADTPAPKTDMSACKADAEKLCPGIQPGGGRLAGCFKEHKKDLSADCKKELGAARKAKKDE